jgi:hypothetical protein
MFEFELGWAEALGKELAKRERDPETSPQAPPKPRRRGDVVELMQESRRRGGVQKPLPPLEFEED